MKENQKAIEGVKCILEKLEDRELFSLCSTVTQGLLKQSSGSREDYEEAIIKYSPDARSFLKRKCITKELLFQYVHENGYAVKLPATKETLIEEILLIWEEVEKNNIPNEKLQTIQNYPPTPKNEKEAEEDEIGLMAKQFCEWYYNLFNQSIPIGPEHFFPDAKIRIQLMNGEFCEERTDSGAANVARLLFQVKEEFNLFFNGNFSKDGLSGRMDPHGLVLIQSCGTLHVNNSMCGVFQQKFGLARDPSCDNNWKVKMIDLILTNKPSLPGSSNNQLCQGSDLNLQITNG